MSKSNRKGKSTRGDREPRGGGGIGRFSSSEIEALKSLSARALEKDERAKGDALVKMVAKRLRRTGQKLDSSSSSDSESTNDSTDATPQKAGRSRKKGKKSKKSSGARWRDKYSQLETNHKMVVAELDKVKSLVLDRFSAAATDTEGSPGSGNVTITREDFEQLMHKAHTESRTTTPVKKGLFDITDSSEGDDTEIPSGARSGSQDVIKNLREALTEANSLVPLENKNPKDTSKVDEKIKDYANRCHVKYFSTVPDFKLLVDMVKSVKLRTSASKGGSLLTAVIRACSSRGVSIDASMLGLEDK